LDLLGVAFVAGLVINTTAGLMWRKANMADDDISFNALGYAIPILSLLFLFFFERADITRVDYLILALGGCGMVVYFLSGATCSNCSTFPVGVGREMATSARLPCLRRCSLSSWRSGTPCW
jgi:hypothetical protein